MIFPFYKPGQNKIDWRSIDGKYEWFDALKGCEQDKIHHAEGDAQVHTKWVCEELLKCNDFQTLTDSEKEIAFAIAVLHDIAKPATSYIEDGRIKTKNHCSIGAIMSRKELYKMGVPFCIRETICPIIKNHLKPFFLIDYDNPKRIALKIATNTRLDLLKIQANADLRGRICDDAQKVLDNIELYWQYCNEAGLIENPTPFSSPHSRFTYFRNTDLVEPYEAFLDKRCEVTVMSGLPGSGKGHWAAQQNLPTVSLDEIRRTRKIKPTDNQGEVIFAAKDLAKEYLRKKTNFIWDATNLSKQIRGEVVDLLANYDAYVKIVYVEANYAKRREQNENREYPVPESVIDRLMNKWEVPDLSEAHEVNFVVQE